MLKQVKFSFLWAVLIFFSLHAYGQKNKVSLVWDFNKFRTLTYSFHQTMQTDEIFDFNFVQTDGKLLIRAVNSDTAEIFFSGMTFAQMQIDSVGDTIPKRVTENLDERFLYRISKSGHVLGSDANNAQTALLLMFPVINRKLADDDSTDIPMSVPFNFFGAIINANGYNHLHFYSRNNCIKFIKSDFDLVNRGTKANLADALCYVKGNGSWVYNAKRNYFDLSEVSLKMFMGNKNRDSQNEDVGLKAITTLKLELVKVEK